MPSPRTRSPGRGASPSPSSPSRRRGRGPPASVTRSSRPARGPWVTPTRRSMTPGALRALRTRPSSRARPRPCEGSTPTRSSRARPRRSGRRVLERLLEARRRRAPRELAREGADERLEGEGDALRLAAQVAPELAGERHARERGAEELLDALERGGDEDARAVDLELEDAAARPERELLLARGTGRRRERLERLAVQRER